MRSTASLSDDSDSKGILKLSVDWDEPGTIQIPWYTRRFGLVFYSTEVLRPRSEPFYLLRELARGLMARIVKREYVWERKGLIISDSVRKIIKTVRKKTIRFLTTDPNHPDFDEMGTTLLDNLIQVSHLLLDQFLDQSLYARKVNVATYPVLLGSRSGQFGRFESLTEQFSEYSHTFQVWNPGMTWGHIEPEEGVFKWEYLDLFVESAKEHHLEPVFGPIVRWDRKSLPRWLASCIDEPYTIRQSLFRYAEMLIHRYSSSVKKWVVASGVGNEMDHVLVQKRIEWADAMARSIHQQNSEATTLIAVERPWGDSLRSQSDIPPLELANSLLAKRSFSGFLIGLDFGLTPDATVPRDAFDLNWLIDQWSGFGRPLYFSFSIPSAPALSDPLWKVSDGRSFPIWDIQTQQENLQRCFLSFLTRKTVSGIFWNRFEDIQEDDTAHSRSKIAEDSKEETKSFIELNEEEDTKMSFSSENDDSLPYESSEETDEQGISLLNTDGALHQAEILEPEELKIDILDEGQALVALSFPHSGLITTDGKPKPALRKFGALKNAYLG